MDALKNTIQFFFFSLTFGMIFFSPIVNPREFGAGFFRLVNNICGAGLFIAIALNFGFTGAISWWGLLALGSFFTAGFLYKEKSFIMLLHYLLQVLCLVLILNIFTGLSWWNKIFFFSSSMLLGLITFSMTLGHWYLVNPKLSEKPLKISLYIIWFLLLFKVGFSLIAFTGKQELPFANSFNVMIFAMRMLWGYLVILILSILAFRLVKIRSIQSATGVLYVMTFFVIIGELISNYFYFNFGIYL